MRQLKYLLNIGLLLIVIISIGYVPATASVTINVDKTDIYLGVGDTYSINASIVSTNTPASWQECNITNGPAYSWTSSLGSISPQGGSTTTITGTVNNSGDYDITISCTLTYASSCGNLSDTGNATVHIHVPIVTMQVRRTGTTVYSSNAVIAANSGSVSTADILIIIKDAQGNPISGKPAPQITFINGDYVAVAPSVSFSANSGSDGKIYGTYTASDEVNNVTIKCGNASVNVNQHWNDLSDSLAWNYPDTFDYGAPSTISYTMAITDNSSIPLTNHNISFKTISLSGLQYDANTQTWQTAVYGDIDSVILSGYSDLVTYSDTSEVNGVYSASQTVNSSSTYHIDTVGFEAFDNGTYDSYGQ